MLGKTAVMSWRAASAGLTLANMNASVRKDIMAKDCNMSAQVRSTVYWAIYLDSIQLASATQGNLIIRHITTI